MRGALCRRAVVHSQPRPPWPMRGASKRAPSASQRGSEHAIPLTATARSQIRRRVPCAASRRTGGPSTPTRASVDRRDEPLACPAGGRTFMSTPSSLMLSRRGSSVTGSISFSGTWRRRERTRGAVRKRRGREAACHSHPTPRAPITATVAASKISRCHSARQFTPRRAPRPPGTSVRPTKPVTPSTSCL